MTAQAHPLPTVAQSLRTRTVRPCSRPARNTRPTGRSASPKTCASASQPRMSPLFGGFYRRRDCPNARQKKRASRPINVGHHRAQLDLQYLPAIKGGRKREYKISIIHVRTRMKYSEIHTSMSSKRVSSVLERAVKRVPPLHLVVTDNAMTFTMAYTAHPERKTTFERTVNVWAYAIGVLPNVHRGRTPLLSVQTVPTMMHAFRSSSLPPRRSGNMSIVFGRCSTPCTVRIRAWVDAHRGTSFSVIIHCMRVG